MEYVDGSDLLHLVRSGTLDAEGALNAVSQVCEALQYAHELGFVHRDIKPANILINRKGVLKVGDFGLARLVEGHGDQASSVNEEMGLTMTGMTMGTPHYAAPEQLDGLGHIDHRADLYSLGIMFYEMLTRDVPRGTPKAPSKKIPNLDVRIDGVVFKAMEPDPDERYQSAAALRTDIDRIRSTPPAPVPAAEPPRPTPQAQRPQARPSPPRSPGGPSKSAKPPPRKSSFPLTAVIVTLVVLGGIFGYLQWQGSQKDPAKPDPTIAKTPPSEPASKSPATTPAPETAPNAPPVPSVPEKKPEEENPAKPAVAAESLPPMDKPPAGETSPPNAGAAVAADDPIQPYSVWKKPAEQAFLIITERQGETFRGVLYVADRVRGINGTVKNGKLSWLAKDVVGIAGPVGGDNEGTIHGDRMDFTYRDSNGSGEFSLQLVAPPPINPDVEGVNDPERWKSAINLLPLINLPNDAVSGTWTRLGAVLVSPSTSDVAAKIQIPHEPPLEYDMRMGFTCVTGPSRVCQLLSHGGKSFGFIVGARKGTMMGLEIINGKNVSENSTLSQVVMEVGRKYTSLVQVRNDGIKAYLDNKKVAEWKTDYRDMSVVDDWALRDDRHIGFGSYNTFTIIHSLELLDMTAKSSAPPTPAPAPAGTTPKISNPAATGPGKGKRVVLLAGETEYRAEEALPQLAKILSQRHGFECTVLFSVNKQTGEIDPNAADNQPGMEALSSADLVITALRHRNWPDEQMKYFAAYIAAGKPIIALRTSTHAFKGLSGKYAAYDRFGEDFLGSGWMSHWGLHKRENGGGTRGVIEPTAGNDPLLRGVTGFYAETNVYEVALPADAKVLVRGLALNNGDANATPADYRKKRVNGQEQGVNAPPMPVAWTRTANSALGRGNKILCITSGSAADLQNEGLRRLIVNAAYSFTRLTVPAKADVALLGDFKPSPNGEAFIKGVKPADLQADATPSDDSSAPPTPVPAPAGPTPSEAGFTKIFNGRDLSGWAGDKRFWSVREGVITAESPPNGSVPVNTCLIWQGGDVANFELRLSFKITSGNSGVQYRSKVLDPAAWVAGGYQYEIATGKFEIKNGGLYEERGSRKALASPGGDYLANPGEKVEWTQDGARNVTGKLGDTAPIRSGDWNELIIIAQGNRLMHRLNGTATIDMIDDDASAKAISGVLALQLHSGAPQKVQFKDIRIKQAK